MKTKLSLNKLYFCFLLCTFFNGLGAQNLAPSSRWTVGADLGFNLQTICSNCKEYNSNQTFSNINLAYRLNRWFELNSNINFYSLEYSSYSSIDNSIYQPRFPTYSNIDINTYAATMGPTFLFRINQGDLAFSIQAGIYYKNVNAENYGAFNQHYKLKYKPVYGFHDVARIMYTYWPRPRFGIKLGLEMMTILSTPDNVFELQSSQNVSGIEDSWQIDQYVSPLSSDPFRINLIVGGCYRF